MVELHCKVTIGYDSAIQAALTLGDARYYEDHSGGHGTGSAEGAPFAFKVGSVLPRSDDRLRRRFRSRGTE